MRKLRRVQDNLKVWKRKVFDDLNEVKAELVQDIEKLDAKEFREGLSGALRDKRSLLRMKLEELVFREHIFWGQRAKLKWAKEGDTNFRFFHRVALGKRMKNFIKNLEVGQGVVVSKDEFIVMEIFNFYSNLYSDGGVDYPRIEGINWASVESTIANWLERPFDKCKVRHAVFECEKDKAPGPDDFSMAVFHDCWDIVKKDLMRVFGEFFESGEVNLCTNATFICLIRKNGKSVKIGDFRPIGLVTSLYKILAKVLFERIWVVLEETIFSAQGVFVQGRQILDVILVANEVIEEYRGLHKEGVVFKVDFEKAYDHGKGVIEGFIVGRDRIGVTHLQFADDTTFFSSNEESKVGSLLKILRIFEIVSGLTVNLNKSSVVGINLEESYVQRVADMLGCSIELFPLKYLGLRLGGDPRVVSFWKPVLVKFEKRFKG
ncbi:uncharacterized protein LOC114310430 [Camellia sinensis]|uniref:uncharacterized protein LOC114310430 n=1 Tax=Camellia sinensis TaxID=4442 RepID=UPI001035F659|nr:uncharacterized protein LOC114310430 [Camellia sinensis]